MKAVVVVLLAIIAAVLLWGADSVKSFPKRMLGGEDHAGATPPTSRRPLKGYGLIECELIGYVPLDTAEARRCAVFVEYIRTHNPGPVVDSAVLARAIQAASR